MAYAERFPKALKSMQKDGTIKNNFYEKEKKMKKTLLTTMAATIILSSSLTAFAAPETMPDGTIFDAEYYAQSNPDVAAVLGTDKNALYQHYLNYGKAEGRLAYAEIQNTVIPTDSVLIEAGDENYLRMGYLMSGFDYSLTPVTENEYYTFENGTVVAHREPLKTPRISDPAADFVRSDWSKDSRYQAIKNAIIQMISEKGAGAEIDGETLNFTQYPRSKEERNTLDQLLKNLSVDLMKSGILESCYLSWSSADGYLYFEKWGYEMAVDIFANEVQATTSQYDKHPEIWNYTKRSRNELYDDSAEIDEGFGNDWGFWLQN